MPHTDGRDLEAVPDVQSDLPVTRLSAREAKLLSQLQNGDEKAFRELIDVYHQAFVRVALIYVKTHAVAIEVVQDTWVAILRGLHSFERRSSLKTWMFKILTNRAKTRGIRENRSLPFSALNASSEPVATQDDGRFTSDGRWCTPPTPWHHVTPERLALRREAMRCLAQALDRLPANQGLVVTLRDIEGLSSAEVCNVLGIRETNQRVLLHRARRALRDALERKLEGP